MTGLVLFVSYSGALGGAERVLIDFASALDAERCLACPEGPLAAAARDAGIRVFGLSERPLDVRTSPRDRLLAGYRLAAHGVQARRLIRDLDPELVVAWGMRSAIALAPLAGPRASRLFAHHDLLPGRATAALVRGAARSYERVVVPSALVASDLDPDGRLRERLEVIHPGVDASRLQAVQPVRSQTPEVLVLGTISRMKRPELALEACALARRTYPQLRLRLVGGPVARDGELLEAELRRRAAAADLAGGVEFAGPLDDARPALARASCLLHCADREPFGIAVLEALAMGCPVVVPDAGGSAELLDGSVALMYRAGDPAAAADGVVAVLEDPRGAEARTRRGRRLVLERFDRRQAAARFAAVARSLTGPRARPEPGAGIAIVTVTHDSARYLEALLRSVQRHLPAARVLVVDCASRDESVAVARSSQLATVVALGENVGFGRACNRGVLEVQAPVTALVNPDVELLDDSLAELAAEALRDARPERLLAPLVISPDGARQDTVHARPGSPAQLLHAIVPGAALPSRAAAVLEPWRATAPRPVGWAVGCALVARTDTLRRLGPFDAQLFLYGEDLDLGLRAREAGIQTWFWPAARVLHHRAHSTSVAFGGEPFDRRADARRQVIARRLGRRRAVVDDCLQALTFTSRGLVKRALGSAALRERRRLEALARTRRRDARS